MVTATLLSPEFPGIHIGNFHVSKWTIGCAGIWVILLAGFIISTGFVRSYSSEHNFARNVLINAGAILGLLLLAVISVSSGLLTWIGQQ
jgi:hypothetical protein